MPFQYEPVGSDGKQAAAAKTLVVYQATNFTAATTEALITLTPVRDGVAGATGTSFVIPSGKRLVLLSLAVTTKNAGAAVQGVQVRVRHNPAGATTASSPVIAVAGAGTFIATANVVGGMSVPVSMSWPSVIEILGDGVKTIGISQIGTATAGNDVALVCYEY